MSVRDPLARFSRVALALSVLSVAAPHVAILASGKYANVDEAYASALGERVSEGYRLYEGAISQRGPLMYYVYASFGRVLGWDNVVGLRAVALAFALANVLLVYVMGRRLLSRTAGAVACIITTYAFVFGFPAVDGIALNGETLQLPALLGGAALGALAMRSPPGTKRRRLRLLLAGVLLGSAISVKPSAGLHPLPMLVWLAIDAAKRTHARRVAALDALIFVLSVVLVPAAFLAHAAAQGTLRSLLYYCVTYNLAVHKNASPDLFPGLGPLYDHLRGHTLYFVLTLGASASVVPFALRRIAAAARSRSLRALGRGFGARHYLALHAIAALALASSLPQHFAHYYVPATPFLALCVAAGADHLFRVRSTARGARRAAILAASFVAFSCVAFAYVTALAGGRVTHDVTVERAAHYVEAHTRPDDKIFVWGFSPWIYGYSHRRPAGRYLFHTYVTGFVPLFWWALDSEPTRVVPGSMAALLGDLDREKPELVVDAGSLMIARPMRAYAPAAAWLHLGYCFEARVGAFDVYRRRHAATCDVPWFPCQHPTLDHWGRPLGVLTPPNVDLAESRRLRETGNDDPHGFDPNVEPAACAP